MAKAPTMTSAAATETTDVIMPTVVTSEPQANAPKKDPVATTDTKGVTHITLG